jgi:predicted amidohydrolase YtcJ
VSSRYWDHHVHLLATAAALLSIDVYGATSVDEVCSKLGKGGPGWLRAWGYDEAFLQEGRHPTRHDIDRFTRDQPVVVHHRSGHAAVLNSVALSEIGEPDHPDGVLFDRHDLLERVPRIDPTSLAGAARLVSRRWAELRVGGFTDATHTNGLEVFELIDSWSLEQRVIAMVSPAAAEDLPGYGTRIGTVEVGHVKLMPGAHLASRVAAAHRAGYPVAVHVMDVAELDLTLSALEQSPPPDGCQDRIEHNALCLPEQVTRIATAGALVVVNPSFLLHRARKYRKELAPVEHQWLARIGSLIAAGVEVRAGSDSPVAPCCPDEMIAAATAHPFNPGESVDRSAAERLLAPPGEHARSGAGGSNCR